MALNGQMPFAKGHYFKTIVTAEAKLDLERKGVQSYQRDIYARFLCFGNGALTSCTTIRTVSFAASSS